MKLAYSTYAMKKLDVFEALPRLRDMGYEGIEIAVNPSWPTEPGKLDTARREKLAALLRQLDFPTPPLIALLSPCVKGEARPAMMAQFAATFDLARDLTVSDDVPVVTTVLGPHRPDWDTAKEQIPPLLLEIADMAAERDVILAIEPHAGQDFETPEKAVWLMENTNHEHLKLNFDYSHFWVEGMDLQHCIDLNLPYAVHNHIKDGYMEDGRLVYLLPGDGNLDLVNYFQVMRDAGWRGFIIPEVSVQISNREDYDPWAAAQFCYDALDGARKAM